MYVLFKARILGVGLEIGSTSVDASFPRTMCLANGFDRTWKERLSKYTNVEIVCYFHFRLIALSSAFWMTLCNQNPLQILAHAGLL